MHNFIQILNYQNLLIQPSNHSDLSIYISGLFINPLIQSAN